VLGGVAPGELAVVALLTFMAILASGALGLMFSSIFRRTIIAVPGSCLVAGILIVATAFWIYVYRPTLTLRYANPVITLMDHMNGAVVGFFWTDLPVWVPCSVFLGLLSLLFLAIATEVFRFKFRRSYATAGLALLLLCLAVLVFNMGESLRTMPEKLDEGTVRLLSLQLMLLALFVAAADPIIRTAVWKPARPVSALRRGVGALLRPGLGLTLTALACMAALWVGISAAFPALHNPSMMFGAPVLAASVALFFAVLCRAIARMRRWKQRVWVRVLALCVLLLMIGMPQAVTMILHAGDNQATAQRLDVVLFANPVMACNSLGGDVLDPYPFLAKTIDSRSFVWFTVAVYGMLAALLGLAALALGRWRTETAGSRQAPPRETLAAD
jgi:hypothetical protein